jgi:FKBP-type peptidyl-prolyl cis-trans isomerase (trigger factor)
LLDSELKRIQEDITKKAQEAKVDKEKYIISHLGYKNHKEFDKALNETAINNISLVLAIEKIISDLKLDISDAEIDEHLIKIAKVYGIKLEDVKERFKGNYDNI